MKGKLYTSEDQGLFDPSNCNYPYDPNHKPVLRPVILIPSRRLLLKVNDSPVWEVHSKIGSDPICGEGSDLTAFLKFVRDIEVPDDLIEDALALQRMKEEYNKKSRSFLEPLTEEVRCECRTHS